MNTAWCKSSVSGAGGQETAHAGVALRHDAEKRGRTQI